jgi:hypothetical protein
MRVSGELFTQVSEEGVDQLQELFENWQSEKL